MVFPPAIGSPFQRPREIQVFIHNGTPACVLSQDTQERSKRSHQMKHHVLSFHFNSRRYTARKNQRVEKGISLLLPSSSTISPRLFAAYPLPCLHSLIIKQSLDYHPHGSGIRVSENPSLKGIFHIFRGKVVTIVKFCPFSNGKDISFTIIFD